MINKIIDILEDNFDDDFHEIAMQEKFIKIAVEINKIAYPKEFMEWVIFSDNSPYWYETHEGNPMYWKEETDTYHTADEVYEYWQKLNKEK